MDNIGLYIILYYIIEKIIRFILYIINPLFYKTICERHKDVAYFAFIMGIIISTISSPICAYSIFVHDNYYSSNTCMNLRMALFISELNRLDIYTPIIVHHTIAILSHLYVVEFNLNPLILLINYTSLFSEIPGDIMYLFKNYKKRDWYKTLFIFNIIQYTILRSLAISISIYVLTNYENYIKLLFWKKIIAFFLIFIYSIYCIYYIYKQIKEIYNFTISTNSHLWYLCIGPHIFTIYGFFVAIGFSLFSFTVLVLHAHYSDLKNAPYLLINIIIYGIIGARLFSIIFEDGFNNLIENPVKTIFRPGFWLYGGILGAIISLLKNKDLIYDIKYFSFSLCIGLPIYETFARIGCHTYGCCFGIPSSKIKNIKNDLLLKLIPIQLISSILFILEFFGLICLLILFKKSVVFTGCISILIHAFIRLMTEKYRNDYRGKYSMYLSLTGKIAVIQFIFAIIVLVFSESEENNLDIIKNIIKILHNRESILCIGLNFLLGIIFYGYNYKNIGSWT